MGKVVSITEGVVCIWQLPRDTRIYGTFKDGSSSLIVHRLDGSYCSVTTEKGTKSLLHHSTRVRRQPDGKWKMI